MQGLTHSVRLSDVFHIAHFDQLRQLLHQIGLHSPHATYQPSSLRVSLDKAQASVHKVAEKFSQKGLCSTHHRALRASHHDSEEGLVNVQAHRQRLYIGTCRAEPIVKRYCPLECDRNKENLPSFK